jgi:hypothetical protein
MRFLKKKVSQMSHVKINKFIKIKNHSNTFKEVHQWEMWMIYSINLKKIV